MRSGDEAAEAAVAALEQEDAEAAAVDAQVAELDAILEQMRALHPGSAAPGMPPRGRRPAATQLPSGFPASLPPAAYSPEGATCVVF